ncbi:MAG: hypothetical protein F4003_01575 [Acidimicrobiaceae bacterium]|nr:hypothetical protein [Acidimicrobiaceae bacterium]MYC41340.1 hypothetical protein [Acidimicrobiaceae bacterium]
MSSPNYIDVINRMCSELAEVSLQSDRPFTTSKLGDRLQELSEESPGDKVWRALSYACNYHFGGSGPFAYGPYEPMFVFPTDGDKFSVFPTPLDRVESDLLEVWAAHAGVEELHPMPRARIADLLWVRRHGDRAKWIEVAVGAYTMAAAIPEVHVVERGAMLSRAVAICQESRNQDSILREDALTALAELAEESISSTDDRFGVVARALTTLKDAGYPCEMLLASAIRKYDSDPWRASDLLVLAIGASTDQDEQRRLQTERIKVFENAADHALGLQRVALIENARSIASSIGDQGEVERLNGLIQRTDVEGDMNSVEVSATIDEDVMRAVAEPIVGVDNLSEALGRFAQYLTPNLSDEAMEQIMSEIAQTAPLQTLIGRMTFGPDGTVVSLPCGSPERRTADIGRHRAQEIACSAGLFGQAILRDLDKRYGMGPSNLIACFGPVMPQEAVDAIVAAHERWQARDHRSAVALLWPTIEQIVRGMSLALGLTTASRQSASFPRTRSLQELLKGLAGHIGENQARYLDAALVDGWALNLRNLYAHGHTPGVDHGMAYGILFHIVCVLRQISSIQQKTGSERHCANGDIDET